MGMTLELAPHQLKAIDELHTGSILFGGVGSGKSRTSLAYYFMKECGGSLRINGSGKYVFMKDPKPLYIITTARKRDKLEWEEELTPLLLSTDPSISKNGTVVVVDSWNNISKYKEITNAFFIFDEQRVVGSGVWARSFIRIARRNAWILLTATPGDGWGDYIPVFVANGFYKNRTEFLNRHAVYSRFTKFPKVDRYIDCKHLVELRDKIMVRMEVERETEQHHITIQTSYDVDLERYIMRNRWDPYDGEPIQDISKLCYILRKVTNSDPSRSKVVSKLLSEHQRAIIFYNHDYELEILRNLMGVLNKPYSEWNGHKHEEVPSGESWVYIVQYDAGAEAWNCTTTDTIIFYSQNYSYKRMIQAAGRIDRLNTPYKDLYYFHLRSTSKIDRAISLALRNKKRFNENKFVEM